MKTSIKDIITDNVIETVKKHVESYIYDDVKIGDIDQALKYNFSDDVIDYVLNNGIMKKLYMMKYNTKKL